ncbi:hypothetical protein [Variovorax ginsengisoli]|uniref:DUF1833 domain-containing protein n=1 Tax=Variovorax ginsengisoli TaxID=363844 RepID=A0ABT9SEI0_9BURK|nr:hypothetical protein [Variovorax ginsengisoli]MDP9902615.1 hypothetical protein [Variovorax ginsengisoli]
MTETLVDQAVDAFILTLQGIGAGVTQVSEDRSVAFVKDDAPAIDVRLVDAESRTLGDNGPLRSVVAVELQMQLAIYTRSAIDAQGHEVSARKLASPIWSLAHARLMADPTLGGLAQRIRWVRSNWSKDSADGTAGWAVHTYSLTLAAREFNLLAPVY